MPRDVPILDQTQLDFLPTFHSFWSQGIPVVVSDCLSKITLTDVGKEFFIRCYGAQQVRLVDCRQEQPDKKVTLADFLSNFGSPRTTSEAIWKLKVFLRSFFLCFELTMFLRTGLRQTTYM